MQSAEPGVLGRFSLRKLATLVAILRELRRLRAHDRWTPEQLHAHQRRALADAREHAWAHSPFYRSFHEQYRDAPYKRAADPHETPAHGQL
jgi:hypothetical protein